MEFGYHRDTIALNVEGAASVEFLTGEDVPAIEDLPAALARAITREAIDSPPLGQLISAEDKVTLVISDITRSWMRQDRVLKPLVRYLHEVIGVAFERMAVLCALGTHRPQTETEKRAIASDYVYERVRVVDHDCDSKDLIDLGNTSRGTPVRVNPLAVGRKVILIGGTVHHLMSGYGGGRKSILPGICGRDTITFNHLHALDPNAPRSSPLTGMGNLEGNPLNEDMNEAARMVGPAFGINLVMGEKGLFALCCGHPESAWRASCALVQRIAGVPIARKANLVLASCGGYPKDINLYQAVKTLLNAAQAVEDGGTLAFIAACSEGGGAPEFFDWIGPLRQGRLDQALREDFTIAGYIFYAACEQIRRVNVLMLSDLDGDTVRAMGMTPFADAQALSRALDAQGKTVYVMRRGGSLVPYVK